jgi:hypothetical protein
VQDPDGASGEDPNSKRTKLLRATGVPLEPGPWATHLLRGDLSASAEKLAASAGCGPVRRGPRGAVGEAADADGQHQPGPQTPGWGSRRVDTSTLVAFSPARDSWTAAQSQHADVNEINPRTVQRTAQPSALQGLS